LIIILFICGLILVILIFAAQLKPPTNINFTTSGDNVTVTWTLPGESEKNTYLAFYSFGRIEKYIRAPQSSYTITLTSCLTIYRFAPQYQRSTYIALFLSINSTYIALLLSFSSICISLLLH
jgi:hypothetical protein